MISTLDTIWVAITAAFIFFMEGGFALLESGFVRKKNAVSVIAKIIIDVIVGGLAFYIIGYGILFGESSGFFGTGGIGLFGLKDLTIPEPLFWFMQMGFAVAAVSIVSGAILERMKVWAYAAFVFIFVAFIYPIAAGLIWNANGWLNGLGMQDFAGSAAVHAVGGFAACAAAIVLGPRIGKYNKDGSANAIQPHSITLASVGAFILWFGWFGFNPGSTAGVEGTIDGIAKTSIIGSAVMNTFLASAAGGLATFIYTQFRYKKVDITMVINGVLAGLVAITAGCSQVSPLSAIFIGFIAGVIVDIGVVVVDKMKIDDPVGAVAVHGINGLWGTIALGLFASSKGLLTTGQFKFFGVQTIGVLIVSIFSFLATFIIFKVLKKTIGIRISEKEEEVGIDMSEFGIDAYSDNN